MAHYSYQLDDIRRLIAKPQKTEEDDINLVMCILYCSREEARQILREHNYNFIDFLISRSDIKNKAEIYMQYRSTFRS